MKALSALLVALLICSCGPSPNAKQTKMYPAGEKANVGSLTYNVIDTQTLPRLGDDPANPRVPQHRFFIVQVAVSNGGNTDSAIPGMTLVDDSGKTYPELSDGAGVQQWLGVVRRVAPGGTETGRVLFDAPASHMKLKLTDEGEDPEILVDLPLNFAHEQVDGGGAPAPAGAQPIMVPTPAPAPAAAPKK